MHKIKSFYKFYIELLFHVKYKDEHAEDGHEKLIFWCSSKKVE